MGKKNAAQDKPSKEFTAIRERLNEIDDDLLLADGFEEALIGFAEGWFAPSKGPGAAHRTVAMYDRTKCIEILMKQGMSHEEAEEYFDFNVSGGYHGEATPVFVTILRKPNVEPPF